MHEKPASTRFGWLVAGPRRVVSGVMAGLAGIAVLLAVGVVAWPASAATTADWSVWQRLDGSIVGGMDAASRVPGRVDAFGRGTNGFLYQWFYDGGRWSGAIALGDGLKLDSDPGVAAMNGTTLHVFARPVGRNQVAYRSWQEGPGWSSWQFVDAPAGVTLAGSPDVASWGTGRLDVVIRDTENRIWHRAYISGSGWAAWENTGGQSTADPSAVSWSSGRLDIFATGLNGDLYQITYENGWSNWHSLSGNLVGGPDVAAVPGQRTLYAFARVQAAGTPLYVLPYTYPGWDSWTKLDGSPASDPAAAGGRDGTITLLTRGTNGTPYARFHTTTTSPPSNGNYMIHNRDDINEVKAVGKQMMLDSGWPSAQWDCLDQLWIHESGWRWNADNPTSSAFGVPQALPGSKMAEAGADWATNPVTQIKWGLDYIDGRYGSPCAAWSFWQSRDPHWY